jgi:hypothetical protein
MSSTKGEGESLRKKNNRPRKNEHHKKKIDNSVENNLGEKEYYGRKFTQI